MHSNQPPTGKLTLPLRAALFSLAGLFLAGLMFFQPLAPQTALAYIEDWDITSFNVDATLDTDASAIVKETIKIDYSRESHHGPYRSIPIRYNDAYGQNFNLRFNLISVTDETGKALTTDISDDGEYKKIRIGDADILIDKPATYIITYKVERAVMMEETTDEFYWNVTGTEWGVPIKETTYTLTLPSAVKPETVKSICFTGYFGSKEQECKTEVKGNVVTGKSNKQLEPAEGLTVSAQIPMGIIVRPSAAQQAFWTLIDNWGYALPFLTFGILFYLWYTRGRDPRTGRETIMPLYTAPDKMTPAEVGTIIDESVDMRDITCTIIDMAVRGYLKIVESKEKVLFFDSTEYTFEKLKDFDDDKDLKPHEKKLMKAIFGSGDKKTLSALKNEFYKDLPDIKSLIYSEMVSGGYFPSSPDAVRGFYYGVGGFLTVGTFFGIGFIGAFLSVSVAIGILLSGIIILLFAKHMPAKTKKGTEAKWQILGLEEFINTAETDRIKFQEKENIFQKLLPYAMALGIAEKWTTAFKNIVKTPPNWYQSSDPDFMRSFNTMYLYHSLNRLTSTANTVMTSSPRSSSSGSWSGSSGFGGGGFSGGGFGGGGGGSW
jgi:uncharacterized membrane protein